MPQWDDAGSAAIRPPSTVVTLTFDDGDADQMTAARVLRRRGLAATFYIITGAVGTPGYVTRSDLHQLAADGNEIDGHTVSHLRLTALSTAEARRQVCESRSILGPVGVPGDLLRLPGRGGQPADRGHRPRLRLSQRPGCGGTARPRVPGCARTDRIPPRNPMGPAHRRGGGQLLDAA